MKTKAKTSESSRPDVFAFHNYRTYLQAMLQFQNDTQRISLRSFAKDLGIGASFLSLMLSGKRTPSLSTLQKIAIQMRLSKIERRALELMYNIAESLIDEIRHESLEELQSLRPYKEKNQSELTTYQYLSKWYFVAVRELVEVDHFEEDPTWIREALCKTITEAQAKEALDFLVHTGLVTRKNGKLQKTDKTLHCDEGIYKMSLGSFYKQMFDLAAKSIDTTPRDQRHLGSHSFTFSASQFEKVREVLEEALDKIEDLENKCTQKDSVYHVGLMAFPLTKVILNPKGDPDEKL